MIRVEIRSAGGMAAMLLPDDSPRSFEQAVTLAAAYRIPATMTCVPIPAHVTGRAALYWYPRTPPKETDGKHETESTGPGDGADDGAHVATD